MVKQIYPCLWFNGNAKDAAAHYCSLFKNSKLTVDTLMVVKFEIFGKTIMGLNGGTNFNFTPAISFFVLLESVTETNDVWEKLIDGGKAMMPIDKYPWSERYGWLQDKFGMTWQISVVNKKGDKQSFSPSMLFTNQKFGKAEEAVNFYASVFENSSTEVMIHYPDEDTNAGKVMFSEFKLNQYNLIAMDGPGNHEQSFNEAVSFVVECDNQEEIDHYWNKLTKGGSESMCGWLKGQYGVSWQIVPSVLNKLMMDPAKAPRVMQAFMKMKKFVITELENA
jgi:predicted 3-demethylubiquinone-9 3-methyltransferase (glyoxalase superfamily)